MVERKAEPKELVAAREAEETKWFLRRFRFPTHTGMYDMRKLVRKYLEEHGFTTLTVDAAMKLPEIRNAAKGGEKHSLRTRLQMTSDAQIQRVSADKLQKDYPLLTIDEIEIELLADLKRRWPD